MSTCCASCGPVAQPTLLLLLPCFHRLCAACVAAEVAAGEGGVVSCPFKVEEGLTCGALFSPADVIKGDDEGQQDQQQQEEEEEQQQQQQSRLPSLNKAIDAMTAIVAELEQRHAGLVDAAFAAFDRALAEDARGEDDAEAIKAEAIVTIRSVTAMDAANLVPGIKALKDQRDSLLVLRSRYAALEAGGGKGKAKGEATLAQGVRRELVITKAFDVVFGRWSSQANKEEKEDEEAQEDDGDEDYEDVDEDEEEEEEDEEDQEEEKEEEKDQVARLIYRPIEIPGNFGILLPLPWVARDYTLLPDEPRAVLASDLLSGPGQIAFDAKGRFFVVDSENERIKVLSLSGEDTQVVIPTGSCSVGLAVDALLPHERLWVPDVNANKVSLWDHTSSTVVRTIPYDKGKALYVASLADGSIVVSGGFTVTYIGADGKTIWTRELTTAFGVAYVADRDVVAVCSHMQGEVVALARADGRVLGSFGARQLVQPMALLYDDVAKVLVVGEGNGVSVWTLDGECIKRSVRGAMVMGMGIDPSGTGLYVSHFSIKHGSILVL